MKLVIDREKWARGNGMSRLLFDKSCGDISGTMCCLGFLALECGFKKKNISMKYTFRELNKNHPKISKRLPEELQPIKTKDKRNDKHFWESSDMAAQLMSLNDSRDHYKGKKITEKMREYKLKRKFKSIGIEVTFIN